MTKQSTDYGLRSTALDTGDRYLKDLRKGRNAVLAVFSENDASRSPKFIPIHYLVACPVPYYPKPDE